MKKCGVVLIILLLSSGCLDFGDDIRLTAPHATANELTEVTKRTGIQFPAGTTGLGYFYRGSGIDDALAIKVAIPDAGMNAFLGNDLFHDEYEGSSRIQVGKGQFWWSPGDLMERKDYNKDLPQGRCAECSLGREKGQWVVSISWIST